jgi:hypothetical protein
LPRAAFAMPGKSAGLPGIRESFLITRESDISEVAALRSLTFNCTMAKSPSSLTLRDLRG